MILKKFTYTGFQSELTSELNSSNSYEYYTFEKSFVEVLDKHLPKKRNIFRDNQEPHVNKTLHSGIKKCSQLKIKAMKSNENKESHFLCDCSSKCRLLSVRY